MTAEVEGGIEEALASGGWTDIMVRITLCHSSCWWSIVSYILCGILHFSHFFLVHAQLKMPQYSCSRTLAP